MGSIAVTLYYGLVPLAAIALAWRVVRRDYTPEGRNHTPQDGGEN